MKRQPTKKYHLRIMYPTSNKYESEQSYTKHIEANNFECSSGSYKFKDNGNNIMSAYPVNFTIIEKIESLEE